MSGLLPVKAESTQEQDIIDVESTSTETSGSDSCTTNGHSLLVKNNFFASNILGNSQIGGNLPIWGILNLFHYPLNRGTFPQIGGLSPN